MHRNFVNFMYGIFILAFGLLSCSRNSHLEFSGRYHPNTKMEKSLAADVSGLPHCEETGSLPVVDPAEAYLASAKAAGEISGRQIIKNAMKNYPPSIATFDRNTVSHAADKAIRKTAKSLTSKAMSESALMTKMNGALSYSPASEEKLLYCLLAILLPPLAVALWEDGITINFWLDILFTLLFWVPGVIFAWIIII